MAAVTLTPTESRGRARGLLLVWRRELEQKLQIKIIYPAMVGGTLEILVDRRLGDRPWTISQKEEAQCQNDETCHLKSVRTKW